MNPSDRDLHILEVMLKLIGRLEERIVTFDEERFTADYNEVDLTAFRLAALAEQSRKLSAELKQRYPDVPWAKMMDLRNVVSHDYEAIDPVRVWGAAKLDLGAIEAMCRAELAANP